MLPSKNINEPLEFIPSLSAKLSTRRDIHRVYFLTVSARETLSDDGTTRIIPSYSAISIYETSYATDDGSVELFKRGLLPVGLPTRKLRIIDWSDYPEGLRPKASLTWVITENLKGVRNKVAELTQGDVQNGLFKFLQVAAVNKLLNNPDLRAGLNTQTLNRDVWEE